MRKQAFTLIELLIVVAIIAILAAIAVPNFLEAQARSKVSACKSDLRSITLSLEAYRLDFNDYPYYPWNDSHFVQTQFMNSHIQAAIDNWAGYTPWSLTTPIGYLTTLPQEAFFDAKGYAREEHSGGGFRQNYLRLYHYDQENSPPVRSNWKGNVPEAIKFILVGVGPDLRTELTSSGLHNNAVEYLQSRGGAAGTESFYDPTNGTISKGDIVYHGPSLGFERTLIRNPT